jgi:uncharacterized protein YbjT (DUF2867 family)
MKVLVVGATGATGRHAVRMLLDRGDDVTVLARDPSTMGIAHEKLHVVRGDVRTADDVMRACEGQDAVLAALGPRSLGKTDVQERFAHNVVAAMKKHGVKRIVNLSAWGAGDSDPEAVFFFRIFRALVLRNVWADKERGEAILLNSGLEYVNARPGRLLDKPAKGGVKAAMTAKGLKPTMHREDLARFMVEQLIGEEWKNKSPLIGY